MFKNFSVVFVPMALLCLLGNLCKRKSLLSETEVGGLKKLVCSVLLPFLVYEAFSTVDFSSKTLLLLLMAFLMNLIAYFVGGATKGFLKEQSAYHKYLISSTEAGMIGYALFSLLFTSENLRYIAVFDAGQSIFFFGLYLPSLQRESTGKASSIGKTVLTNPVIWGLVLGVTANLTGFAAAMSGTVVGDTISACTAMAAGPVSCIMLFVVGYGISFDKETFRPVLKSSLLRTGVLLPLSLLFAFLIGKLGLDPLYQYGVILFGALPASYLVSAYVTGDKNQRYVNTQLSFYVLYTLLVTIVLGLVKG